MSKEKLSAKNAFSLSAVEAITPEEVDYDFLKSLSKDSVKEVDQEQKQASEERQKQIESLYPTFTRRRVPLAALFPASDKWNFFPVQDDGALQELMKNIAVYGQLSPAIVWEQPDGTCMILGGHTRYRAIQRLYNIFKNDKDQVDRFTTMECNVYAYDELDEVEARKIIIYDNVIRRENSTAIKARSVITMAQLEKDTRPGLKWGVSRSRTLENVATALGENVSTVKRIYQLRNLIPEFWPLVGAKDREDKITNQFAMAIAMLPPELQHYIFDNALYIGAKLTAAQMSELKAAKNSYEVDKVFNAPEIYTVTSKLQLAIEPPAGYKPITLLCAEEETNVVKELIEQALNNSDKISNTTKKLVQKIFL